LIEEYEQSLPKRSRRGRKPMIKKEFEEQEEEEDDDNCRPIGFARGLKPKKVLNVTEKEGEIYYTIEWFNSSEVDLIASKIAKQKCPQLVIEFLQSKLTFNRKPGQQRPPLESYRPTTSKNFSLFNRS
jgi:hypothetical protein